MKRYSLEEKKIVFDFRTFRPARFRGAERQGEKLEALLKEKLELCKNTE